MPNKMKSNRTIPLRGAPGWRSWKRLAILSNVSMRLDVVVPANTILTHVLDMVYINHLPVQGGVHSVSWPVNVGVDSRAMGNSLISSNAMGRFPEKLLRVHI